MRPSLTICYSAVLSIVICNRPPHLAPSGISSSKSQIECSAGLPVDDVASSLPPLKKRRHSSAGKPIIRPLVKRCSQKSYIPDSHIAPN
ncbi:hypothetical protein IF1G_09913 [Cordyceps javanica]|uniref:Uncharacterized protein n=1 Tax=Cordyceps javanica TaxID=43265 RepID=A0A545UPM1_9HYPO|nr:hypothetical protein IF1G_09913 [Cordyceps javanica]